MTRRKLVAGNWKMNGSLAQLGELDAIAAAAAANPGVDVAVCVPATLIAPAAAQPGFGGSILLIDPPRGKVLAVGFWETEAALRASEGGAGAEQHAPVRSLLVAPAIREVYEVSVQVELTAQGAAHMRGL